uniref:Uncharacterized protein n=1 Tax=Nelumbo nucifera TaxID=4432 RepID=A0A822YE13_NELNU|nr:TPA_asm: hypothetical protein HUJ06_009578 [Nelumbo nucifera]
MVIKIVICLALLTPIKQTFAKPRFSEAGRESLDQHHAMGRRHLHAKVAAPWWWSADYSPVRRRRPVHNKLDP